MKTKTPLKIKLLSICALVFFALNLFCINILRKTEISWIYFFVLNLFFAIPVYIVAYLNLKLPQKLLDKLRKNLPYVKNHGLSLKRRLTWTFNLGYLFYMLFFAILFYGINYHYSDGNLMHYKTTRFGQFEEDLYSSDEIGNTGVVQSTRNKIMFFHNDIWMVVYKKEKGAGKYLHYTMDKGLFGFNVVKDCYFSNSLEPNVLK